MPPPPEIHLTHRGIVEACQSQANLIERRGGAIATRSDWKDTTQIAEWCTDVILHEFHERVVRAPDTLTVVTDRFAWPDQTEGISLVQPRLINTHPVPSFVPFTILDLQDERAGVSRGVPIEFASPTEARNLTRGWRGLGGSGAMWAVIVGDQLQLLPFPVPVLDLRLDYIAYPEAVKPEGDMVYRGLPAGVLRATVTRAAAELSVVREDPQQLVAIAAARLEAANRAADRKQRTGPELMNWSMSQRASGG